LLGLEECLPSMHEALGLIFRTIHTQIV
jgi:hypothetical protein